MPTNCSIASCKNTWHNQAGKDLSFHRFPKDDGLAKIWISRCCRKDPINAKTARICSEHFDDEQFERDLRSELLGDAVKARRILKDEAIPTVNLPYKKTSSVKSPGRSDRAAKRRAKALLDELLIDSTEVSDRSMNVVAVSPSELNSNTVGCQSCSSLQAKCDRLRKQLEKQMDNHVAERNRLQARIRFWREAATKNKASFEPRKQYRFYKVLAKFQPVSTQLTPTNYGRIEPMACLKTMKIDTPEFHGLFTPELNTLAELFGRNQFELRIAGGAVRDLLMGKRPSDLDFATTATPQQMQAMFESEQIRMINNKGEKHGTVTCRINDKENFEVTTLRVDVETDGRHAQVQFTTDWQLDAERRDLTINSMFLGFDGTLYDYYSGQEDLLDRKVRFVGDAATRIQEDYLRILRYFRFYGRICSQPNTHSEETLKAIRQNVAGLEGISGERIWIELKKILQGQHVSDLMKVMFELGVARYVGLPASANLAEFDRVWSGCADLNPLPMTLLSALLSSDDQVMALNKRVKMSKDELQLGLFILTHRNDDFGEKPFDFFEDLICDTPGHSQKAKEKVEELIKYRNLRKVLEDLASWTPPKFPVSGFKLAEFGVPKGKQYAKVLGFLRAKWKESRYTLGEEELLKFVDEAKKS